MSADKVCYCCSLLIKCLFSSRSRDNNVLCWCTCRFFLSKINVNSERNILQAVDNLVGFDFVRFSMRMLSVFNQHVFKKHSSFASI